MNRRFDTRGGTRPNAGRPRLAGKERDAFGRIKLPAGICACGGFKVAKSARCKNCWILYKKAQTKQRICVNCQNLFIPLSHGRRCCSDACTEARDAANHAAQRIPEAHSDKLRAARRRRYSRLRSERIAGVTGSKKKWAGRWRRIGERDGWTCWLCSEAVDPEVRVPMRLSPSVDHVVPLAHGGSDDDKNLRLAHFGCNSRRCVGRFSGTAA